jgi:uncharacterized protein (TIGR02145 family)
MIRMFIFKKNLIPRSFMKKLSTFSVITVFALFLGFLIISSCKKDDDNNDDNNNTPTPIPTDQFTDSRDGKVYKTVVIGTQTWMAQNLDYVSSTGSYVYNDSASLESTYGRLYTWDAAQTACPSGWHLPDTTEWSTMINYLGGISVAGGKLKEAGTTHWNSPNTGADNSSGFTALPGGSKSPTAYQDFGNYAFFWTSTAYSASNAKYYFIDKSYALIYLNGISKAFAQSVRCVKD